MLHNLTVGILLVTVILFLFLGNARGALIVALTIPFSLLFASICLDLRNIPGQSAVAGRAGFRDGGGWRGGDGGKYRAPPESSRTAPEAPTALETIRDAAHEVQRPVFYAIGIIITAYVPIFTLQRVEGRLFKPMAWTVAFALLGALTFSMLIAPVLASFFFRKGIREWHNPVLTLADRRLPARAAPWPSNSAGSPPEWPSPPWRARVTWHSAASSAPSFCRIWTKALSGCAARLAPSTGPTEGIRLANQARVHVGLLPRGAG